MMLIRTRVNVLFVTALIFSGCGGVLNLDGSIRHGDQSAANDSIDSLDQPLALPAGFAFSESTHETYLPAEITPWSAPLWEEYQGGISFRWQTDKGLGNDYHEYLYAIMTKAKAQSLAASDIDTLSPAEKFDLWKGRNYFPLAREEQTKTLDSVENGAVPISYGLCHGFAASSLTEVQPGAEARVKDPQGREITFYYADIAGLLAKIYGDYKGRTQSVGRRCLSRSTTAVNGQKDGCGDLSPKDFHIAVVHLIADQKKGFVVDFDPGADVQNRAVYGYRYSFVNKQPAASRSARTVTVTLDLYYTDKAPAEKNPSVHVSHYDRYQYDLDLDAAGKIINGRWVSQERPDFLWVLSEGMDGVNNEVIDYASVKELLRLSVAGRS